MTAADRLAVSISIRHNATGEVRTFTDDISVWEDAPGVPNAFMWEHGNYRCDCNRFLYFERAGGGDPDLDEAECGDGGYSVNVTLPDGTPIYEEFK